MARMFTLIMIAALLLLAATGCPAPDEQQADTPQQVDETHKDPANLGGEGAPAEPSMGMTDGGAAMKSPIQVVTEFMEAMNNEDFSACQALMHPDCREAAELEASFNDLKADGLKIVPGLVELREANDKGAMVHYEMQVGPAEGEGDMESESGKFELQFVDGAWLIIDVD